MIPSCIVIPAAGRGVRLSQGVKSLVKVSESETLLARMVRQFRGRWPETPIFVGVGYQNEKVRNQKLPGVHCVLCREYEITNVSETVRLILKEAPPGPSLICLGDLVFSETVIPSLQLASPGVLWGECGLTRIGEVGLTVSVNRCVGHLTHDLAIRWAQLAFLDGPSRSVLERILERPGAGRCYMYENLNRLLARSPLLFDSINGWIVEVDINKDLHLARLAVKMENGGVPHEVLN